MKNLDTLEVAEDFPILVRFFLHQSGNFIGFLYSFQSSVLTGIVAKVVIFK